MAEIHGQFERLQRQWLNSPDFPFNDRENQGVADPLLFGPLQSPNPWNWRGVSVCPAGIGQFVTPRGGAYFYVPSISWLKKPR
jgi:hypothetical protein